MEFLFSDYLVPALVIAACAVTIVWFVSQKFRSAIRSFGRRPSRATNKNRRRNKNRK